MSDPPAALRLAALLLLALVAAACGGATPGVRDELRRVHGYAGREDDGASIATLEARPDLLEAALAPSVAELSRVLAEDYATPFDPRDVPELVAWSRDVEVREALLGAGTRAFARALVAAGAFDGRSLRIRGGPLWRHATILVAALARQPEMTATLLELRAGYRYRLDTTEAPALRALSRDGDLRAALRREKTRLSWARLEAASGVAFRPGLARAAIDLASDPRAAVTLGMLRSDLRLRTDAAGVAGFARLWRDGRGDAILDVDHVRLLALLRDRPGPSPALVDLPGTLLLAELPDPEDLLESLLRLGWSPAFGAAAELEALRRLGAEAAVRRDVDAATVPPNAGRSTRLRSLTALLDAIEGRTPRLGAWLGENDLAFLGLLPDPGGPREALEREILESRGDRRIVPRPRTGRDETGKTLPWMNRVDLLKIRAIQASLRDPETVSTLLRAGREDRADRRAEHGGRLEATASGLAWIAEAVTTGEGAAGDRHHRLAAPPDPRTTLATWHVHARGGEASAGPSVGRVASDLAAARRARVDGVVVTLLGDARVDVDFHDDAGHVLDLGVFP